MLFLRAILFAIACSLTLIVPAKASAMIDGIGSRCAGVHEKQVGMGEDGRLPAESEAAVAVCVAIQAIAPREMAILPIPVGESHIAVALAQWTIVKRPAGIERPPRA